MSGLLTLAIIVIIAVIIAMVIVCAIACEIKHNAVADVVPVVRCKDCIYRSGKKPGQPNIICIQMHDDDFCSYGERKGGDSL